MQSSGEKEQMPFLPSPHYSHHGLRDLSLGGGGQGQRHIHRFTPASCAGQVSDPHFSDKETEAH